MNMKCKICQGCLKVMRIDREESFIFWYCPLCQKIFEFYGKRSLVEDEAMTKEIKEDYIKVYGNKI